MTLTVTTEELDIIAAGLNELPRKLVEPLFQKLARQVQEQEKADVLNRGKPETGVQKRKP